MIRQTAIVGGLVLGLALLLGACTMAPPAEAPTTAPMPPSPAPETSTPIPTVDPDQTLAQEIWARMQASSYQEGWTLVEGKGRLYRGLDPHGALLSTYLNDLAAEAMKGQVGTMPDGAMIVKENYMADATLAAITVMYKEAGYDPDHNDWFWASTTQTAPSRPRASPRAASRATAPGSPTTTSSPSRWHPSIPRGHRPLWAWDRPRRSPLAEAEAETEKAMVEAMPPHASRGRGGGHRGQGPDRGGAWDRRPGRPRG